MITVNLIVDGAWMPLGEDDLIDYLSQYGEVRHPDNMTFLLLHPPGYLKQGKREFLTVYLNGPSDVCVWNREQRKITYCGKDLVAGIAAFLEERNK